MLFASTFISNSHIKNYNYCLFLKQLFSDAYQINHLIWIVGVGYVGVCI